MGNKGILIVVSAPSGCGKTTVLRRLMERREKLHFSVSATTREPREGERDGVDYYFIDRPRFLSMIGEGAFLEYAEYVKNYYGTPKAPVDAQLEKGFDVYLDIEVQGAMQVKAARPDSLLIFLMPPSMEELRRRLVQRGQDDPAVIEERLAEAARECAERDKYDFIVVNDEVDRAVAEIDGLVDGHKLRAAALE